MRARLRRTSGGEWHGSAGRCFLVGPVTVAAAKDSSWRERAARRYTVRDDCRRPVFPDRAPERADARDASPVSRPLRDRLHEIIFEADTPAGRLFDLLLLVAIL